MKQVILRLISVVFLVFLSFLAFSALERAFKKPKPQVPTIITRYDTVQVTPRWLNDSIKAWKSRKATTDTVNIIISNTIISHDTIYIGSDTANRPRIWPVLEFHGGVRFGDTASIVTFSLHSGLRAASRVFTPGILTDIEADTGSIPKLTYAPFPEPKSPPLLYRLKYILAGALLMKAIR